MVCFDGGSGHEVELNWGSGAFMIRDPLTRSLVYVPQGWGSKTNIFMAAVRIYIV
jgi:hypothetical protein